MASTDRSCGIIVRGVTAECTEDALKSAFSGFGSIVDVFVKASAATRRGYAFVTFSDQGAVSKAIEGAPTTVGDDSITVEARTPPKERMVAAPSMNIYIKGLSESATEEDVASAIAGFGNATSMQVSADRGFAFAGFDSVEEASAAVAAQPLTIGGASCEVEFRMSKPRSSGGGGGGGGRRKREPKEANSVYIKGCPAECDDDAISSALAGFGTVVSVSHREGRDFAFVVFDSDAGMNAAVAAGAASIGGADATIEERN
jgi:RNA recognition motif-containing protein